MDLESYSAADVGVGVAAEVVLSGDDLGEMSLSLQGLVFSCSMVVVAAWMEVPFLVLPYSMLPTLAYGCFLVFFLVRL